MGYPSLFLSFCLLCIDNVDVCVFILECKLIHIHFSGYRSHENPGKCEFFYCHVVMTLIQNKTAVRKMIIEGRERWKQIIKASFHSSYFQLMKTEGEEIHQTAEKQLCTLQAGQWPGSCTRGGHLWLCQCLAKARSWKGKMPHIPSSPFSVTNSGNRSVSLIW